MDNLTTSSEKAYQAILKVILEGTLPRGEFLSQRMLAELADTSIISVREALKRLEYEHLIESIPKWGVRIPVETRTRIKDLYGIREALEVMVAYMLCTKNDRKAAEDLYQIADEIDNIDTSVTENIEKLSKRHRKFHLYMAESTGNNQLLVELKRLSLWSLLYQDPKKVWEVREINWKTWHKDLVNEIFSLDPARAQEAMHKHIQHGMQGDLMKFDEGFFN
jgi:DNA-binding GntR family transcriptional regulator